MLVDADYHGYSIEVHPELSAGRWNAVVRIRAASPNRRHTFAG
jgi:hypothetical protein